jgi:hypothetical protein
LPPDHTTLCRFRVRLGAEGFQKLFNQVVEQARAQGFVSDRLHFIDATDIAAKVDLFRLKKEHAQGDDDDTYVDRNSPDPEARFGRKSKKKGFYGYKAHIVEDADSELIVGVKTTPGKVPDGVVFPELIDGHPREATGIKVMTVPPITRIWRRWGWPPALSDAADRRAVLATPAGSDPKLSASFPKGINAMASKRPGTGAWPK